MTIIYYKLVYTWKYEPKDLFQGKHNLVIEPYTIIINEGKIIAEVYNPTEKEHHSIIQGHVENYFKAASIISGFGYSIDKDYDIEAYDENGEKLPDMFVTIGTVTDTEFVGRIVALTDEEKQQILKEEKILGEFFVKYYHAEDPIIRFIYESYKASLTEERFLTYLHDIKEAMKAFLSNAGYNVSSDDNLSKEIKLEKKIIYDKIGEPANNEIRQGRHSGKKYIEARDINPSEKAAAMEAAKKIMLAFFKKLRNDPKLVERLDQK